MWTLSGLSACDHVTPSNHKQNLIKTITIFSIVDVKELSCKTELFVVISLSDYVNNTVISHQLSTEFSKPLEVISFKYHYVLYVLKNHWSIVITKQIVFTHRTCWRFRIARNIPLCTALQPLAKIQCVQIAPTHYITMAVLVVSPPFLPPL